MAPRSMPVPVTVEEKLSYAAVHSGVATIGPVQAAELLALLAAQEEMQKRARAILAEPVGVDRDPYRRGYRQAASDILGAEAEA